MRPNAWHWVSDDRKLRDGRDLPAIGETLVHEGDVVMCESGLHASRTPLRALAYAPGSVVCRVYCNAIVDEIKGDKLVAAERTILWQYDASDVLRKFARLCSLDVIHLWDAPDVVVRWLRTGDESLRDATSAAWRAAYAAADSASAACRAAYSAAYYAADSASAAYSAAFYAADSAEAACRAAYAASDAAYQRQNRRLTRMLTEGRHQS